MTRQITTHITGSENGADEQPIIRVMDSACRYYSVEHPAGRWGLTINFDAQSGLDISGITPEAMLALLIDRTQKMVTDPLMKNEYQVMAYQLDQVLMDFKRARLSRYHYEAAQELSQIAPTNITLAVSPAPEEDDGA